MSFLVIKISQMYDSLSFHLSNGAKIYRKNNQKGLKKLVETGQ
jgi:hypothetical protein